MQLPLVAAQRTRRTAVALATLGDLAFHVTDHERRGFGAPDAHFNGLRAKQPSAPIVSSM
jgi:hypothetical protein